MPEHVPQEFLGLLEFRQYRLTVIEFFRLPLNISEDALREAIEKASPSLLRNYLARANGFRPVRRKRFAPWFTRGSPPQDFEPVPDSDQRETETSH